MALKSGAYDLVVVAHPDDETIYFGSLLLQRRTRPWLVVCVTDGNADGQGKKRRRQFARACALLNVRHWQWWEFPDVFAERLDIDELVARLNALPPPHEVFTHGVLGEYGHPHHQDVSFAVHRAFHERGRAGRRPVYSVAYNCFPDLSVSLSRAGYARKTEILSRVYGSETRRFANLLPATASEGFTRVSYAEVHALYRFLREGKRPPAGALRTYRWFWPYLRAHAQKSLHRLF